ncbi:MAG: hypothetical protein QGI13_12500 [Rhodospirillales bacterium]|jgi:hypothetical protein|nr:hypothetical protein [Rhodospirillales bacterium]
MRLEPKLDRQAPTIGPVPAAAKRKQPLVAPAPAVDLPQGFDIRNASPRRLAEASMDFYVAGLLDWEEYAMLAFQPELHPDYDRTIGALTGRRAAPDKGRDCLAEWEERLAFEQKYRGEKDETAMRTLHIVTLFQRLDAPSRMVA